MRLLVRALPFVLSCALCLQACTAGSIPDKGAESHTASDITGSPSAASSPPSSPYESAPEETPFVPFNDVFYNPLWVVNAHGDPWLTYHDGTYWFTNSGAAQIVAPSRTISGLMSSRSQGKSLYIARDEQNQTEIWANELHFYQGKWYMFYAGDYDGDNTLHRMYALRSLTDDAMGEWEYAGKLDLPDDQWAIDGTFFENVDGRIFLIWSGWRSLAEGTSMWLQRLYITELEQGDPTKVISAERVQISIPTYGWEGSVLSQNEGPAILVSPNGTVYCAYSANYSASDEYCIGLIRLNGDDPMIAENWEKFPEPLLASDKENEIYAPGHCSFTKSPDGTEDWMIYHAAKASGSGWDRSARAQKVEWVDDVPYMGKPVSLLEPQKLPSGEIVNRILIQAEDCELVGNATVINVATVGAAVRFNEDGDEAVATVRVDSDGEYIAYIRHSNYGDSQSNILVRANDASEAISCIASRSGAEGQYVMTYAILSLNEGLNTIHLTAGPDVDIDLIILDLDPPE